ncbi:MAG: hypothetical protein IJ649_06510 [Oscillospiraceae bacterium]|nr:hypothetical protein [Oscillospiraceae bacterium]
MARLNQLFYMKASAFIENDFSGVFHAIEISLLFKQQPHSFSGGVAVLKSEPTRPAARKKRAEKDDRKSLLRIIRQVDDTGVSAAKELEFSPFSA